MPKGSLWAQMDAQPKHPVSELTRAEVPANAAVYAWYHNDETVYVGTATRLLDRLWGKHLGRGRVMTGSAFRRDVAEALGIASANDIKQRVYELDDTELARVRAFIEECEVVWLIQRTPADALELEKRMRKEWLPPLNKV